VVVKVLKAALAGTSKRTKKRNWYVAGEFSPVIINLKSPKDWRA
jgi:hypothetical protein